MAKSSSLVILLIQDQVWPSSSGYIEFLPGAEDSTWTITDLEMQFMETELVWVVFIEVHFLKILGKMKVDWKHVGTTAWNGKMLSLSVKPCARWWEHFCRTRRGTAAKPGTLGGIISSMPFHVLRIIVVEVILDFNVVEGINVFDIGKKVSLGCTNGWESTS